MKSLLVLVCFFVSAYCWIGLEIYNNETSHPGHCYTDQHDLGSFEKDEVKQIRKVCGIAECLENRNIKYTGCSPVMVHPPCRLLDGDLTKPFPECCYEIKCDQDNQIVRKYVET